MELCYEGGLVMPSSYAMMDEEEMTYVEGGMSGRTRTREERVCTATFIAAAAVSLGRLSFNAFKVLAAAACTGLLAFFGGLGFAALMAATFYESTLAGIASFCANHNKNYSYKYYGLGPVSVYTMVRA